jgi:hypothetical protein
LPLQFTKQCTTLDELEKWQAYFIRRRAKRDKSDWYHAAIIAAIYNASGNIKSRVKIEDCLLSFSPPKPRQSTQEQIKQTFLAVFGIKE